jgi:hypothetical protein
MNISYCAGRVMYWRMPSSRMLCHAALVRTDVSGEPSSSIIWVTRIGELCSPCTLQRNTIPPKRWFLQVPHYVSSQKTALFIVTENLKCYMSHTTLTLWWTCNTYADTVLDIFTYYTDIVLDIPHILQILCWTRHILHWYRVGHATYITQILCWTCYILHWYCVGHATHITQILCWTSHT